MTARTWIRRKRDGHSISRTEIQRFIEAVVTGTIPDYQIAALLMAIFWRGLTDEELVALTEAMASHGSCLDLDAVPQPKIDKHSTGGVGDKVSICLAPLVAACGGCVPMIAGRGLGHTGGTLDKLSAIRGFRTDLSCAEFAEAVRGAGFAISGQAADVAPADGHLYALRDATATVESLPLITSSILSKKLAEGIDALVVDVKVGSGAFCKGLDRAHDLARLLCSTAKQIGLRCVAMVSDMSQPLGREVGNANELAEAIEVLQGGGPPDVVELTMALGADMLLLAGLAGSSDEARGRLEQARQSGQGLDKLRRCVEEQGGDTRLIDNPAKLPRAPRQREVLVPEDGILVALDTELIGRAAMVLGAGRQLAGDPIDSSAGITMRARLGERLSAGDSLATLHHADSERAASAEKLLLQSATWGDAPIPAPPLVHGVVR